MNRGSYLGRGFLLGGEREGPLGRTDLEKDGTPPFQGEMGKENRVELPAVLFGGRVPQQKTRFSVSITEASNPIPLK